MSKEPDRQTDRTLLRMNQQLEAEKRNLASNKRALQARYWPKKTKNPPTGHSPDAGPVQPEPPADLVEQVAEAIEGDIAEAIGAAYDCIRAWEAWWVGTMRADDFQPITDNPERLREISTAAARAALTVLRPEPPADLVNKIAETICDGINGIGDGASLPIRFRQRYVGLARAVLALLQPRLEAADALSSSVEQCRQMIRAHGGYDGRNDPSVESNIVVELAGLLEVMVQDAASLDDKLGEVQKAAGEMLQSLENIAASDRYFSGCIVSHGRPGPYAAIAEPAIATAKAAGIGGEK